MDLKRYFEQTDGLGVLSTADDKGQVNTAIYARPHVQDDGTVAFIMANRLSHENLKSNPHASYLFKENDRGYSGKRLSLTKIGEEVESDRLEKLMRRTYPKEQSDAMKPRSLVFFRVNNERPLVGS